MRTSIGVVVLTSVSLELSGGVVAKLIKMRLDATSQSTNAKKTKMKMMITKKLTPIGTFFILPLTRYKFIRWNCCKKKGHKTVDCPKDPNFRMEREVRDEFMRVLKMGGGEDTKVFDNLKLTSDLLKMWSK